MNTRLVFLLLGLALSSAIAFRHGTGASAGRVPPGTRPDVGRLKSLTFEVQGQSVTLVDGVSESPAAPGSASRVITRYFGNEVIGDLDGDGRADAAFLLTQTRGGSGTFYYVVAALSTNGGYAGTNAVLLGDRVAPQSLRVTDSALDVTFAERAPGAPMTAAPSVGVSKALHVVGASLVEH